MLKFFRKIRWKLIDAENLKKYFFYAIGEILLVVIGILIALQINNWNLRQIDRAVEIEILEGIKENILVDSIDINHNIRGYRRNIMADSILYTHLTSQKSHNDTIAYYLFVCAYNDFNLYLHGSSFTEAQERGLGIISNKELRKRISRFYEFDYTALQTSENNAQFFNHRELLHTALSGYLEPDPNVPPDSPFVHAISAEKYEQLLADKNAHHKILMAWTLMKDMLESIYYPTQAKARQLVEAIDEELVRLRGE